MGGASFSIPSNRFSLGNFQLHLNPVLMKEMRALQQGPPSAQLRNLFLQPKWSIMTQSDVDSLLRARTPGPKAALVPRGQGPASPKAAEVGDLLKAIWGIPTVRNATGDLLNLASRKAKSDWGSLPGRDRALLVSWSGLIAGSALTTVLVNKESRKTLLDLLVGRDIPVPGLNGLKVQIRESGAGASLKNVGNSGIGIQGGGGMSASGSAQYDFMLTLDLDQYFPK